MKLFKGQYGWSTSAHSKSKTGEQKKCFLDVTFAKNMEPIDEETEGILVFKEKNGPERECFFSSYEKQGVMIPKLVIMPPKFEKHSQMSLTGTDKDVVGYTEIKPEELPFY